MSCTGDLIPREIPRFDYFTKLMHSKKGDSSLTSPEIRSCQSIENVHLCISVYFTLIRSTIIVLREQ